jgi:uncharacterized membrane protein
MTRESHVEIVFRFRFVYSAQIIPVPVVGGRTADMDDNPEIVWLIKRIDELEQKLSIVERQLADMSHSKPSPPLQSNTPAAERTSTQPPVPQPKPDATKVMQPEWNLESIIAGRWLNRVGLLLVLIATALGLKYGFDNEWIGPSGRVTLGMISGISLMIFSQWLRARGYRYFAEGITALGGGVLYLSLYSGWDSYKLLSSAQAFAAMIAVTVAILWIAEGLSSQRLALMALTGGFLAPMLVSTGQNVEAVLFSYILILDASLLWLAWRQNWRSVEPVAFVFSVIYFWAWYDRFYDSSESLTATVLFATAFFALFVALPAIRACVHGRIYEVQVVQMLFNAGNYLFALHWMLWAEYRWGLTGAVIGLSALHLAIYKTIPRVDQQSNVVRILFAGLALTFISLAIPIRLEGIWISISWSIEGAVLVWSGFRTRWWFLRASGCVLFAGVIFRFFFFMPAADVFLLNLRFATFAIAIGSMAAAVVIGREQSDRIEAFEHDLFNVLGVTLNVLALWALSLEVRQYFAHFNDHLGRQMALSLLWTTYASGLLISGERRNSEALRWQGLVLFGIAVGKVFLYDLSFLSGGYRIISSIVLGVVLLGVSFLYQRHVSAL